MIHLGTEYGGWLVNLDLIPENSTIISAGVGEDISFDLQLINLKNCKIIGIDPTVKSHNFIQTHSPIPNFTLLKKALASTPEDVVRMFTNTNPNHVSESILQSHDSVNKLSYHLAETVTLDELYKQYNNISLIKMDIEGSEYSVLENIEFIPESVKQLCVEFHHFCTNKTIEDTKNCILKINNLGFKNFIEKPSTKELNEITFWR